MKKRIIVVGGGYAGITIAEAFDGTHEVTLIEPREAFVHNVAAIRSIVEPALLERLIIPYDRLLKNGKIMRAKAEQIEDGKVTLNDGCTVEGDIIIAATGSQYADPFKPRNGSMSDFRSQQLKLHDSVNASQNIVVVGAGPVGVELAAEIIAIHPTKKVTILAASDDVVPGVSTKLSRALREQLTGLGIGMRLGVTVEGLQQTDKPFAGELRTGDETYSADLVVPVFGARPVVVPMPGSVVQVSGRLTVDQWMRPKGFERVFALGDVAENGDPMTVVAIRRQATWLKKALNAVLSGKSLESFPPYSPATKPLLLVPLGRKVGTSILPLSRSGMLAGSWATQKLKGQDLFIKSTRKELGY